MGKKIICESCGTIFPFEKVKGFTVCPVCNASFDDREETDASAHDETFKTNDEHPDWITWYYYKDPKYGDYSLWNKPPLQPEKLELIKEFKAPQESACGLDEVKRILRTYVPEAFSVPKDIKSTICCPKCGSQEFTLLNRGYSIWTGFLGSGKVKRVCNRCKMEF